MLLMHYYPQLTGLVLDESGSHENNIGAVYEVLGPEKSNTLVGFHAFSFFASEDVLPAFADLGVTDELADLTVTCLEKYMVRLFCKSGNMNSLTDVRWSMYTKQQDCNNLPSTKAAL